MAAGQVPASPRLRFDSVAARWSERFAAIGAASERHHDLRHTFASHLIIDLGHASIAITLDVYTHLFDDARHAREIHERMAASQFASLLKLDRSAAVIPFRTR